MDSQIYPPYAYYSYFPPPQNPNPQLNHHPFETIIPPPPPPPPQPQPQPNPPGVNLDSYTTPTTLNSYHNHPSTTPHVVVIGGYEAQAYGHYYQHQSSSANYYHQDPCVVSSQSWVDKDVIRQYGAPPLAYSNAIDSLNNNSIYPMGPNNFSNHPLPNDACQRIPKTAEVLQFMRCEVCKIDCNSKDVFDRHMLGRKHKRNLLSQEMTSNNFIFPAIASIPKETKNRSSLAANEDMETKRRKLLEGGAAVDSVMVCSICNVVCNSKIAFADHLAGKSHAAQAGMVLPNTMVCTNPFPVQAHFKKTTRKGLKKPKIVQSAWCEICSIDCNSRDVLNTHKIGKKHQKKLEMLNEAKKIAATPASTSSQMTNNPMIGPQENPSSNNENTERTRRAKKKPVSAPEEGVETKLQKIVSEGAAADAVRVCAICSVVCNSQTAFNFHLAGQKHTTMVKKQAEASGITNPDTQVVNAA